MEQLLLSNLLAVPTLLHSRYSACCSSNSCALKRVIPNISLLAFFSGGNCNLTAFFTSAEETSTIRQCGALEGKHIPNTGRCYHSGLIFCLVTRILTEMLFSSLPRGRIMGYTTRSDNTEIHIQVVSASSGASASMLFAWMWGRRISEWVRFLADATF